MDTNPLISIIVPVYNKQEYIGKCLHSLLRQTYPNIEIIVIDDCSSDHSASRARHLLAYRKQATVMRNNCHTGMLKSRYAGADRAQGLYTTFVDADDWLEPTALEQMLRTITELDVDLVQMRHKRRMRGMAMRNQERYDPALTNRRIEGDEFRMLASYVGIDSYISPSCRAKLYISSKLKESARMELDHSWGEEQIFNIQYLRECKSMAFSNFAGYNYRWGGRPPAVYRYSALKEYKNMHQFKRMLGQSEEYINDEIKLLLRYHIRSLITELGYTREAVEMLMNDELRDPLWKRVGVDADAPTLVRQEYTDIQRNPVKYFAKRLLK